MYVQLHIIKTQKLIFCPTALKKQKNGNHHHFYVSFKQKIFLDRIVKKWLINIILPLHCLNI